MEFLYFGTTKVLLIKFAQMQASFQDKMDALGREFSCKVIVCKPAQNTFIYKNGQNNINRKITCFSTIIFGHFLVVLQSFTTVTLNFKTNMISFVP